MSKVPLYYSPYGDLRSPQAGLRLDGRVAFVVTRPERGGECEEYTHVAASAGSSQGPSIFRSLISWLERNNEKAYLTASCVAGSGRRIQAQPEADVNKHLAKSVRMSQQ